MKLCTPNSSKMQTAWSTSLMGLQLEQNQPMFRGTPISTEKEKTLHSLGKFKI
jgi:hypothetical protein